MHNKVQILKLYKDLLRESGNFKSYYYKNYFTRKTQSMFKKHTNADPETSEKLFKKSQEMLAMLKRQTMITNAYDDSKLVIENSHDQSSQTVEK